MKQKVRQGQGEPAQTRMFSKKMKFQRDSRCQELIREIFMAVGRQLNQTSQHLMELAPQQDYQTRITNLSRPSESGPPVLRDGQHYTQTGIKTSGTDQLFILNRGKIKPQWSYKTLNVSTKESS